MTEESLKINSNIGLCAISFDPKTCGFCDSFVLTSCLSVNYAEYG